MPTRQRPRPSHVRAGQTLALSFARFDLEQHYDTVKVFDGPTAASPALHTGQGFSGLQRGAALRALAVNASGATLLVVFTSDASITEAGFTFGWTLNASYTFVRSQTLIRISGSPPPAG